VSAPPNVLTNMISTVPGWNGVTNRFSATVGAFAETDDELRARYRLGVYRLGAGTLPSIRANVQQDIADVVSLAVYENPTDATDADGRPPHSVEVVIEGGDDASIAQKIRQVKPAGIRSHGNTTLMVPDDTGYQHEIKFSRPEERWVWLRAALTTTSEEALPGDVNQRVAQALAAAGNALGPGDNVYLQRLTGAALSATTGVARVDLTVVATAANAAAPASGAYGSADIAMNTRQRATFDLTRITLI
jgi:hypothetical protein